MPETNRFKMINAMYKQRLFFILLLGLFQVGNAVGQTTPICNNNVYVSLDNDCVYELTSADLLENISLPPNTCPQGCNVEIFRIPQNVWEPGILTVADVLKNQQFRVTDLATGNSCTGIVRAEDKVPPVLDCTQLTRVALGTGGSINLSVDSLLVSATDNCYGPQVVSLTYANGSTSRTFDCTHLGMQVVTLRATDGLMNTATCQATILIEDLNEYCLWCLDCPDNQIVSFEQGTTVLLPQFQAENLDVFDQYGSAQNLWACPGDTLYDVTYNPGASGYSWFTRNWELNTGGSTFAKCNQTIAFPSTRNLNFTGKVYIDTLANCQADPGEPGTDLLLVRARKFPGNEILYADVQADGSYNLDVLVNATDTLVELRLILPSSLSSNCVSVLEVSPTAPQSAYEQDFGLSAEAECYETDVSLQAVRLRRCFGGNKFYVRYCNYGLQEAQDAYMTIQFDSLITVENAQIPYTAGPANTYTFQLGDLPRLSCNTFFINTAVSCDAELNTTLCATAAIFPNDLCDGPPMLTGPLVEVSAICEGDSVLLQLYNAGMEDMSAPSQYIVVEDILMNTSKSFQLNAGATQSLRFPANGSTWRIEADQAQGALIADFPSAAVEGCGGINIPGLLNAFPQNDNSPAVDVNCAIVVGSWDPNDKSAVPTGYNPENIIRANTEIEYLIRFQNTGTDTAFRVEIRDTLSAFLDAASVRAGASSHNYRLDIRENGILNFIFDNIMLPDSNVDVAGSQGFIQFRIAQKADLPLGTVIENTASIYFDFNDPIVTNTVFHTIGAPFMMVGTQHAVNPLVQVRIQPNPMETYAILGISGHRFQDGLLRLYSIDGKILQNRSFSGNQVNIERMNMPAGNYFFQLSDGGKVMSTGVLICK